MKLHWSLIFLFQLPLWCGNTTVLFQPSSPSVGPFPTNLLTTSTASQKTGLQVNLPLPAGCSMLSTSAECTNTFLLNQLDGFSVNPRITVCFSGPVDVRTLRSAISFTAVDRAAASIGINQVIYDPASNCVHAKPDQVLDQQARYLLTVTSKVLDVDGNSLNADKGFSDCLNQGGSAYCQALSSAIDQVNGNGNNNNQNTDGGDFAGQSRFSGDAENAKTADNQNGQGNGLGNVIGASLFTTLSATRWLESARAQVNSGAIPDPVLPAGPVSTFTLSDVKSITWMPQSGVVGSQNLPLNVLGGVEKISFGLFLSPIYLNLAGPQAGSISTTPTNLPIASPNLVVPVSFHVFLPPSSAKPKGKIPVIIYGHGLGDNQFGAPTYAASTWANNGFATLAIEIIGHGFGTLSTTQVTSKTGTVSTVTTPGRGIQFPPAAPIGPTDGCILPGALATRDCGRQTAVDLMALVRTIRDTDGLGLNLDRDRIYYVGQSFGSIYGTLLEAVEPNISAGTLNSGGGTQTDVARLSPIARLIGAFYLGSFTPPLLNVPPAPPQPYFHDKFNDEYVYRDQVITDSVKGALPIQAAFEEADWLGMLGDPLSYAGHLKTAPLTGVKAKSILVQFGSGDLEVPNPTESALVRAGGLQSTTWLLRTDKVAAVDPRVLGIVQPGFPLPIYPHRFLSNPTLFDPMTPPLATAIGVAAQSQVAEFFASGGKVVQNPNKYLGGLTLFENPAVLPEALNFLQIQQ